MLRKASCALKIIPSDKHKVKNLSLLKNNYKKNKVCTNVHHKMLPSLQLDFYLDLIPMNSLLLKIDL